MKLKYIKWKIDTKWLLLSAYLEIWCFAFNPNFNGFMTNWTVTAWYQSIVILILFFRFDRKKCRIFLLKKIVYHAHDQLNCKTDFFHISTEGKKSEYVVIPDRKNLLIKIFWKTRRKTTHTPLLDGLHHWCAIHPKPTDPDPRKNGFVSNLTSR